MRRARFWQMSYKAVAVSLVIMLCIGIFSNQVSIAAVEVNEWMEENWEYKPVIQRERTLGFNIEVIEGEYRINYVAPMSPAYYMGLVINDSITAIDDVVITDKMATEVKELLKIPKGELVKLTIKREEYIVEVFLISVEAEDQGFAWETLNDTIIFQITYFDSNTLAKIEKAINRVIETEGNDRMDGIIIDVRNNRSSDYEVGAAIFNSLQRITGQHKSVVLVNDQTSNAAELFVVLMQKYNQAYIIGMNTKQVQVDLQLKYGITQKAAAIDRLQPAKVVELQMNLGDSVISIQGHMGITPNQAIRIEEKNKIAIPLTLTVEAIGSQVKTPSEGHYVRAIMLNDSQRFIDIHGNMYNEKLHRLTKLTKHNDAFYITLEDLKKHFGFNYVVQDDSIVITYTR